jgi:HEAT repeat protein
MDCTIDAGGLPFTWLTGVNAAQSVALLEPYAAGPDRRLMNAATAALAIHKDPAADAALDRLSAPSQAEDTRRQAAFWLGNARGRHGYESLLRILRDDPSDRVREHAVFALTQSKETDGIPTVVKIAHDDKSVRVRSQALFWLAQKAARNISEDAIRHAIEQDPDTEVKKKAVFALTQIPNGDGVPLLIEIARNNRNAAVKKQAMFWLGQSKDARALKFFEDVLATR